MKATVVDLIYKMSEVLKALKRREKVTLLYHGKVKGVIFHAGVEKSLKVENHPFFKMSEGDRKPVSLQMKDLRGSRFNDL